MSTKRGERPLRPVVKQEWTIRNSNKDAGKAWAELSNTGLKTALAKLYDILTDDPRWPGDAGRHHQLHGEHATKTYDGRVLEKWQHEISGSGRVWFLVDDEKRTVWLVFVGAGHPPATA